MPLFLFWMMSGCVSYTGHALTSDPPSLTPAHTTYEGLLLGVDLPRDGDEIRRSYGVNLLRYGILPVEIAVTNVSSHASYVIDPAQMSLAYDDGEPLERVRYQRVHRAARFSQWRSVLPWLLVLPGLFVSENIRDTNAEMLDDFRSKEMAEALPLHPNTHPAIDGVRRVVYYHSDRPIDLSRLRRSGVFRAAVSKTEGGRRTPKNLVVRFDGS